MLSLTILIASKLCGVPSYGVPPLQRIPQTSEVISVCGPNPVNLCRTVVFLLDSMNTFKVRCKIPTNRPATKLDYYVDSRLTLRKIG